MIRFVAAAKGKYDGMPVKAGRIYTIAGTGAAAYSGNGRPATAEALNGPAGVSVGPSGRVLIADNGNDVIRWVTGTAQAASGVRSTTAVKPASGPTASGRKVAVVGTGLSGVTGGSNVVVQVAQQSRGPRVAGSPRPRRHQGCLSVGRERRRFVHPCRQGGRKQRH
jgi:hypothetical protein